MTVSMPDEAPEYFNFVTDSIDKWAADPKKLALHWVSEARDRECKISFAEMRDVSKKIAGGLQAHGFHRGDRIVIVVGRDPAWWLCMTAMLRAGIVAVPGTTLLMPKDYVFRIEMGHITGIVVDQQGADRVDQIRDKFPNIKAFILTDGKRDGWISLDDLIAEEHKFTPVKTKSDETSMIYFTSGTTGMPKMVVHTHASFGLGHRISGGLWLDLKPDDLHWNLSDTGWAKVAYAGYFGPWSQGAAVFVQEARGKFDGEATLETLSKYPITAFCGPPTAFRVLITLDIRKERFPHLRKVNAAGEPLNPEVLEEWKKGTGITMKDGYGQSETVILAANFPGAKVKPGSMGVAAPGFEIDLVDENLKPVPVRVEGEIAVRVKPRRPIGLFKEYENNPEENAAKFQGDYYLTGDRAFRDEEGYLWFVGRSDDVILSGGYRIGPFEIESALIEHPAVLEAGVIGAPDPDRYQIVKAYVTLRKGFKPSADLAKELQDHVKKTTAPYKYPREIEFVEELPKTISGKIRRVELRQRELGHLEKRM